MANTTRCGKGDVNIMIIQAVYGGPIAYVSKTVRELSNGVGLMSACYTESTDLLPPVLDILLGVFSLVSRFKMFDRGLVIR